MSRTVNKRKMLGYMYMIPSLVILIVFVVYPVLYGFATSMYDWDWVAGIDKKLFVGLGNYLAVFKDGLFWNALKNTILFAVLSLVVEFVLGLCCAMLLYKIKKGGVIFRTILIFPLTISDMVAAIMWRMMLDPASGVVNQFLNALGLKSVDWLGNSHIVIFTMVLVEVWWMTGNITLIMLAGLQSMPIEQLECGEIDGANGWQKFKAITFPGISPTTFFLSVMMMISSLQAYDQIQILTQGGPAGSTRTLLYLYYQYAFEKYKMGEATAIAAVLMFLTIGLSILQFAGSKKWVNYEQ